MKKPENDSVPSNATDSTAISAYDFLSPIEGPELFFGLVAPIGTDVRKVSAKLKEELSDVGYETSEIHVTDILPELKLGIELSGAFVEQRYDNYISAGNWLREKLGRNDAFALLSLLCIRRERALLGMKGKAITRRTYILHQFKRPEEIEALRTIYGASFFQISAYSSKQARLDALTHRIAESHSWEKQEDSYRGSAYELIVRDEAEEDKPFGQRVRDTFPMGDIIINASSDNSIEKTCNRFVRAIFGDGFVSPTKDEVGAQLARAAALRSADLSRQVGAAIMTTRGEIVTLACNEVPKAGGGAYWEGDPIDRRDFREGSDSNADWKRKILQDAFRRLKEAHALSDGLQEKQVSEIVDELVFDGVSPPMKDSQVMDILEFGRVVHAEMHALSEAARLGRSVKDATLFCTTFPYHICARHIVASGIGRVVYIEPYSKSVAADLYPDSIDAECIDLNPDHRVRFETFIGIAPVLYERIFSMKERRKDSKGKVRRWNPQTAQPIVDIYDPTYLKLEEGFSASLFDSLQKAGLIAAKTSAGSADRSPRP